MENLNDFYKLSALNNAKKTPTVQTLEQERREKGRTYEYQSGRRQVRRRKEGSPMIPQDGRYNQERNIKEHRL